MKFDKRYAYTVLLTAFLISVLVVGFLLKCNLEKR